MSEQGTELCAMMGIFHCTRENKGEKEGEKGEREREREREGERDPTPPYAHIRKIKGERGDRIHAHKMAEYEREMQKERRKGRRRRNHNMRERIGEAHM